MSQADIHAAQPVLAAGESLDAARGAMIMIHGRGANAPDILGLARLVDRPGMAYLAPDAAGHVWYQSPFMSPGVRQDPGLPSALGVIQRLMAAAGEAGLPPERVALLGFSQGACLALEFAARNPRRYGAIIALSGGLIGERIAAADYSGSLDGTPVFLGCSDVDPFIPLQRVQDTAAIMGGLGAAVTLRIYPNAAHTIVNDEIDHIRAILDKMLAIEGD